MAVSLLDDLEMPGAFLPGSTIQAAQSVGQVSRFEGIAWLLRAGAQASELHVWSGAPGEPEVGDAVLGLQARHVVVLDLPPRDRTSVRWQQLYAYEAPEAWVRRVALNLAAQAARRPRRQARALLRLGPPMVPLVEDAELDLARALAALPLGQRQVVVLHYLAGMPVRTSPGSLGCRWGR